MDNIQIQESFIKDSILTIIEKTCMILQRRIGEKISVGQIPIDVITAKGEKLSGIPCILSDGRMIRWNWKTNDTSCTIISLTYWSKIKIQPDIEVDLNDYNIVNIIDAVAEVLNTNKVGDIILAESVYKYDEAQISDDIKKAISAWSEKMMIDDNKLSQMRMKELWRSFRYWYEEIGGAQEGYRNMSEASFRNYMIAYFDKYGIKNPHVKVLKSVEAGKEKIVISDKGAEKAFNAEIYEMSLADKKEFAKQSIVMIAQGLQNALIIGGEAGGGKTKLVNDSLNELSGMKIVRISGGIKNTEELFKVLYNNNDSKTIIVFDDTDSVFDKKNLDIMKSAMSPDSKREITWYSSKINADKLVKSGDAIGQFLAKQQGIEIKKSNKKEYSPTFEFKSKIIIITNRVKHKIDGALLSRGTYIEITFSKEDMLQDIRNNVSNIFPEYKKILTDEIKMEVLEFISQYVKEIFKIDYRLFKTVLSYRLIIPESPQWKKYAMSALRALT